ncbi:MAG: hypothetical protein ABGW50_04805, partial [Thermococcus sp.]
MEEKHVEVKELEEVISRTRKLPPKLEMVVTISAVLIGIYEILFIFNFNGALYDMLSRVGIKLNF